MSRRWAMAMAAAVGAGVGAAMPARGAVRTWDGGGTTDNLSEGLNWVGDVAPNLALPGNVAQDELVFAGLTRLTPFNDASNTNSTALNITFVPSAGQFNLGGNVTVLGTTAGGTTGNGNIVNNSSNTQTFSAEVRHRTGQINAAAGDIVFNGVFGVGYLPVTFNDRTSTFTGPFNTYLNGQVTMGGRLTRAGSGITFITNDTNNYGGETRIENGVIRISAPNALGANDAARARTIIAGNIGSQGRLELVGGQMFAPEPVTLEARQGPSINAPHIVNFSGNNTWTGPITFAAGGFDYLIYSNADKLTMTGTITSGLAGVRNLRFGGTAEGEVSGNIGTNMSVIKEGPGTWTLSNPSNGYNGTLTVNLGTLILTGAQSTNSPVIVNGGTLKVAGGGSLNGTTQITVNSGGTLDVSDLAAGGGFNAPFGGRLEGTGTVKGQVNVGPFSAVAPGRAPTPGTLTVEGGVAFNGGSGTFAFVPGANSLLNVVGDVSTSTSSGQNNINISGSGLAVGNYDLIKYTGALRGDGIAGFTLGAVPPRATMSLVDDTAGKSVDLRVTAIDFPRWIGDVSSDWDINTTQNWREVNSGQKTTYLQPGTIGDTVLFDDQAQGANPVVNIAATVSPGAITFNNNTKDYLFTGGAGVSGPGQLTKNGTGRVTLTNFGTNDYSGGTVVNAGTLQIGDDAGGTGGGVGSGPVTITEGARFVVNRADELIFTNKLVGSGTFVKDSTGSMTLNNGENAAFTGDIEVAEGVLRVVTRPALGDNTGALIVLPGGTFDVMNQQMETKPIRVGGAGFGGQGALISSAGGSQNAFQNVTLTSDTTVGGPQRFDIRNLGNPTTLSTEGNAYNLTKIGPAQFSLVGVTVDPALGDVNINEGIFSIEVNTTGLGDPSKTINLGPSGQLLLWRQEIPIDKKVVSGGGTIRSGSGTQSTLVGPITLNADTNFIHEAGTALTLTNALSGAGGLIKSTHTGSLVLGGASTYTGPTAVNGGTLRVTGSIAGSSGVTVNSTGTFEAAASQRVKGLTVNDGGRAVVIRPAGAAGPTVLTTPTLTIGTTSGQVDLVDNAMIVDYDRDPSGGGPLLTIRAAIVSGYNGGAWNGPGIMSSAAQTSPFQAVGYAEASAVSPGGTFLGQPHDDTSVLVRTTIKGDANLNGTVAFEDLVALAQNYNLIVDGSAVWSQGDFDYNGNVGFTDLVALAQNYGRSMPAAAVLAGLGGAGFVEDVAAAFAQVPEPGVLSVLGVGGMAVMGRRRRRRVR